MGNGGKLYKKRCGVTSDLGKKDERAQYHCEFTQAACPNGCL